MEEANMISSKAAPAKMLNFISELVVDLPIRCKVVSVEVEDMAYLLTLWQPDRGLTVQHLSAFDISRSMRGDPEAVAMLRENIVRNCGDGSVSQTSVNDGSLTDCSLLH